MIFLTLLIGAAITAGDTLEIRFIANAGFELYDGETTLLMDLPYESGAFGGPTYDLASILARGRAVSVITHGHADHFDRDLFLETGWEIVGPEEVTGDLPPERVVAGADTVSVGAFRITRFPTPHGPLQHYAYLITWRGRRVYFSGDTDDPSNLLSMSGLDVAVITPWLSCAVPSEGVGVRAEELILQHHWEGVDEAPCLEVKVLSPGESVTLVARGQ
jgi:L-ascorbate metabolism protein UlaG (beta-lactamase superfamily)